MANERLILGAIQSVGCSTRSNQPGHKQCCIPGGIMHEHENQRVEVGFIPLTITSSAS